MHPHGLAEIAQQLLRAPAAGVLFIGIPRFAVDQFLIFKGHAAAAGPVLVLVRVDVIEFYQSSSHTGNASTARSCKRSAGAATIDCCTYRENSVAMARICEVCGRGPQFGHRISHAHNVSNRRWNINLQTVRAVVKGATRRIRVCTSCIRSGKVQKAA